MFVINFFKTLPQPCSLNFVRWRVWIRQPDQFWRRPPPPGQPAKEYPLEPAAEAMKNGPYRLDRWTDWRMKKDWLRRQCVIKLGRERMMMDTLHNNDILPMEIRVNKKLTNYLTFFEKVF